MAKIGPESGRGPTVTILQFRHMGGALARELPGAGARATLPGEVCAMALGVVIDEASDAAVREALADFDAVVAPHRAGLYANFVEDPADASALLRARRVGAPAGGQGAVRPGGRVRGQPPRPAGAGLTGRESAAPSRGAAD